MVKHYLYQASGSIAFNQNSTTSGVFKTQKQIKEVEGAARRQSDNSMLARVRKGRLRARNFGPVFKCSSGHARKPSKSLLRTLLGDYDLSSLKE